MIDLVFNKLKELGYPVEYLKRPAGFPSIDFHFFNINGAEFADNEEIETEYPLQVNIWTKGDFTKVAEGVKSKLKEIEFYRLHEDDDYEEKTEIYHKILVFTTLKGSDE